MNIPEIPTGLTQMVGRQLLVASKHSPRVLFAAGIVGVVATAVTASRATMNLSDTLEEHKNNLDIAAKLIVEQREDYTQQDYRKDVAVVYARAARDITRLYAPTVGIGIISVACLTGSHHILMKRNMALTAAYGMLDRGFKEYRRRVIDEYGEDADRRFRYDTEYRNHEYFDETDGQKRTEVVRKVKQTNDYSIYARFFDESCGDVWSSVPEYNRIFLHAQQNFANDMLRARGHIFLNEVYDSLGLERSKAGAVVGWVWDNGGDNRVDFGIFEGSRPAIREFVNGQEGAILLDFNVDGVIYDKI